jgi:predicted transcriptional regulator
MKRPSTIRLSDQAWAALGRLAQRDSRTMSGWLEQMVRAEALAQGCWAPQRPLTAVPRSERAR